MPRLVEHHRQEIFEVPKMFRPRQALRIYRWYIDRRLVCHRWHHGKAAAGWLRCLDHICATGRDCHSDV